MDNFSAYPVPGPVAPDMDFAELGAGSWALPGQFLDYPYGPQETYFYRTPVLKPFVFVCACGLCQGNSWMIRMVLKRHTSIAHLS